MRYDPLRHTNRLNDRFLNNNYYPLGPLGLEQTGFRHSVASGESYPCEKIVKCEDRSFIRLRYL